MTGRQSLDISVIAAVAALLVGLMGMVMGGSAWAWVVGAALAAGTAGYVSGRVITRRRVRQLSRRLHALMRQNFDALHEDGAPPVDRDFADVYRQLQQTAGTLERELEQLRKKDVYRREFIGNVSHELKTPIFALQGYAETLLSGALEDPEVRRSFVEKIQRNANRLDRLAGDLTEISRIETGDLTMSMEAFDIREVIREAVELLTAPARDRDVEIRLDMPANPPAVRADREHIRQVLVNLIDNAIKYNRPNGTITARVRPEAERVEVSVEDTGIGIDPALVPRLTERFYRIDASRTRSEGGTGLGLAIVKHILQAHDTALHIESEPGQGSRFMFRLPVTLDRPARR